MESKKINQLATAVNPSTSDLAIIGDPVTGVSKKITWLQVSTLIGTAANLQQVTDNGATTTNPVTIGGLTITGLSTGVLKSDSGVISSVPFGAANGVATLAGDGKIPSSQLPSYVDDVVEVANYAALPVTGETGKLYITLDNNKVYRWGGSVYVEVAANNGVWGSITGTLSNQTDLQNALNAKATDSLVVHLAGTETITGTKTFSNPSKNDGGILLKNGASYSLSGYMNLGGMTDGLRFTSGGGISNYFALPSSVGYTYTFPAISGTIVAISGGNSTQYIDGTGSLQTFPTLLSSDNLVKLVRNQSGATMTAGTIVYISGATGNKPLITKALATGDATSAQTFGLVQANIANNADGYVVVIGNITDIDTSALTEGQQLYLSGTTAGAYTTTKPYAPTHLVYIGIVLRSHPTQGIIGVKIQNGYEMDELHNVDAQSPSNNDILSYNTSTSLWEHKQIATTLGFTPISLASLSATSPLSYNNTTGAFSIQVATASQNGYLSSTDWSTFNNKQAALGGTGFVKISGSTISYDNSTYYLASNPSGFITLASLSAGAGISYSNITGVISSTITQYTDALARAAFSESVVGLDYSSSTGVLSTTTGYAIPTTAKQTEWDTAYTNRITSLTTLYSSGAATLVANTLNVPTYTLSGLGGQPLDADLTAIAALAGTSGFLKKTAADTWALDTNTYLTGNQTITLSGDVSGSGATAITTTIGALKVTNAMLAGSIDLTTKVTGLLPDANISSAATWNAKQAALNGTGFVKATGTTISYDNSTYLTTSSASSTYLPLVGGTLTGALNGTSATFSGGITTTGASAGFNINRRDTSAYAGGWYSAAGSIILDMVGLGTALSFAVTTGAATFTSSITTTAAYINNATFSEGATYFDIDTLGGKKLRLNNSGNQLIMGTNGIVSIGSIGDNGSGAVLQITGAATLSSTLRPITNFAADLGTSSFRWADIYGSSLNLNASAAAITLTNAADIYLRVVRGTTFNNIGVDATGAFYNTNSNHKFYVDSGTITALTLANTGAATFSYTIKATNLWEIRSDAEERLNGQDNNLATARRYYHYATNEMRFYANNTSGANTAVKLMEYNGINYDRVLNSANYNSYAPTLTGGNASGTWAIAISGKAGSVDFNAINGGTSVAYSGLNLKIKAATSGYGGFNFLKRSDDSSAGYLLIADAEDVVYDIDGIALVADKSWLTLAQRNISGKGIKIITGDSTLTKRFEWLTDGTINSYSAINSYGGFKSYNSGAKKLYDLTTTEFFQYAEDNATALSSTYYNLAANTLRFYSKNGSGVTSGIRLAQYTGSTYDYLVAESRTITINGTTYDLSANRSWTIGGSGSAAWSTLSGGTRTGYDIASKPATSTGAYGGFQFKNYDDTNAGYLLVSTDDNDTYTAKGLTLVADTGWLTLAQRSTASKGIQFSTGTATLTKRMSINTAGYINMYITAGAANDRVTIDDGGKVIDLVSYGAGSAAYSNSMGMFVAGGKDALVMVNDANIRFVTGGYTEVMRCTNAQYLLIGYTSSAGTYKLQVNGKIYASDDIIAFSDISVKKNIRTIDNALERVTKSRGVIYDRKDIDSKNNIGFIAQELEKEFPELISTNSDGTKGVKYQNAVAVLFEAIKEQQNQINDLKKQIA